MVETPNAPVARPPKRRRLPLSGLYPLGILLLVGIAYQVIPWYYYYFDLRNQIAAVMRNGAIESDEELKGKMAAVVATAGISSRPRDIVIERSADAIRARLLYTESCSVTVMGRTIELFSMDFNLSVSGKIR
jgi:hypothetical protein